jgi:hypothetical protein
MNTYTQMKAGAMPGEPSGCAERDLWACVLFTALEDATDTTRVGYEHKRAKREAIAWLRRRNNEDFREVCWNAGFDPDHVFDAYEAGRINTLAFLHGRRE